MCLHAASKSCHLINVYQVQLPWIIRACDKSWREVKSKVVLRAKSKQDYRPHYTSIIVVHCAEDAKLNFPLKWIISSFFRDDITSHYILCSLRHLIYFSRTWFTGTCGQDPPPFFLNIDFFPCKQHFATLYISLDCIYVIQWYIELQNVIYMNKNIDVQEKGGGPVMYCVPYAH